MDYERTNLRRQLADEAALEYFIKPCLMIQLLVVIVTLLWAARHTAIADEGEPRGEPEFSLRLALPATICIVPSPLRAARVTAVTLSPTLKGSAILPFRGQRQEGLWK